MTKKEFNISEGIQWLDITEPDLLTMDEFVGKYRLDSFLVKDSMEPEHLPRFERVEGVNYMILRYHTFKSSKGSDTIQQITNKIALFYTKDFIISFHVAEIDFIELIIERYVKQGKYKSVDDIVIRIVMQSLKSFEEPVERLGEQIDFHENNILIRNRDTTEIAALYGLKRQASLIQKMIVLMQEPLHHLNDPVGEDLQVQDVIDEHEKMKVLYTQIVEEATNLMSLYMSYTSQRTNEVMKVLTIFSVFFMPLTFIVGIYGMNFKHMPEITWPMSYPLVWLIMILVTVVIYIWFRRKGWL